MSEIAHNDFLHYLKRLTDLDIKKGDNIKSIQNLMAEIDMIEIQKRKVTNELLDFAYKKIYQKENA